MKKIAFKMLAFCTVLAALTAGGTLHAKFISGTNQHLGNADCAGCHQAGNNVTVQDASMLTAGQEALCEKCHPTSVQVSHPSGFQPNTTPPRLYPLDWKGNLTCSTCHDIHGSRIGLMRSAVVGQKFCLACHEANFFSSMRDGGASLMAGHLAAGVDSTASGLDAYSLKCMECHGNSATPWAATSLAVNGVVRPTSQSANHPIGMRYEKAVSFGGYRPRSAVELKLSLPGGNVSCVSCHFGYPREHGKLVVTQAKSALCQQCHDL